MAAWGLRGPSRRSGVSAAQEGARHRAAGRPRCFPAGEKDLWPPGASAARGRLREPTKRRRLTKPGRDQPQSQRRRGLPTASKPGAAPPGHDELLARQSGSPRTSRVVSCGLFWRPFELTADNCQAERSKCAGLRPGPGPPRRRCRRARPDSLRGNLSQAQARAGLGADTVRCRRQALA